MQRDALEDEWEVPKALRTHLQGHLQHAVDICRVNERPLSVASNTETAQRMVVVAAPRHLHWLEAGVQLHAVALERSLVEGALVEC